MVSAYCCGVQLAISAAWGMMPWLLWDTAIRSTTSSLPAASLAVVSALVLARGSNMTMFVCAIAPLCLHDHRCALPLGIRLSTM